MYLTNGKLFKDVGLPIILKGAERETYEKPMVAIVYRQNKLLLNLQLLYELKLCREP